MNKITFNLVYGDFKTFTYEAEEGMTFADWVNSSYNTDGWKVDSSNILYYETIIDKMSGKYYTLTATSTTVITNGSSYNLDAEIY